MEVHNGKWQVIRVKKIEGVEDNPKRPVGRPPLESRNRLTRKPEEVENVRQKRAVFPRDYFKIDAPPEEVARVIMNTKPKKRGKWDFEKRD